MTEAKRVVSVSELRDADRALTLIRQWDGMTPTQKDAERAKGSESAFSDVAGSPELGFDGFEVNA